MGNRRRRRKKNPYVYVPPKVEYIYNSNYSLEIKESSIKGAGLGVFAKENIPNYKLLGEYIGTKKSEDQFTCGLYAFQLSSGVTIDAYDYPRTVFAMINDSRFSEYKYNCKFMVSSNKVEIWSIDEISVGDELFISYGSDYWKHR